MSSHSLKGEESNSENDELMAYQEILTSLLFSAHRDIIPNFLHVDNIFRTDICKRFFPETTIAFRMEKCFCTLEAVLRDTASRHRLTLQQIEQHFFQLFCVLTYMHSVLNVSHLDLKPSNCLLTSMDGTSGTADTTFQYQLGDKLYKIVLPRRTALVKIADLGSSISNASSYEQLICGTAAYRPPEFYLWGFDAPAGGVTDVWATGLMMFEAYAGIAHDEFIERLDMNDDVGDYLIENINTPWHCQLLYGFLVLFSTREDIALYRGSESVDEGWLVRAGAFAFNFVSFLVEDDQFQEDWRRFSVQEGRDASMVRLRSQLGCGDSSEDNPKLDTFLSMLSVDPCRRLSAGRLATSPLFQHMALSSEACMKKGSKTIICRLGQELFEASSNTRGTG